MTTNYQKIYDYLKNYTHKVITASQLAYGIEVDRIYGGTMAKLVRDGYLEKCPEKGFYTINHSIFN